MTQPGRPVVVIVLRYAGIVFYSGNKLEDYPVPDVDQTRDAPIAPTDTGETKNNLGNYIEVKNNSALVALNDGQGTYEKHAISNDVMFCITDTEPLDVVPCP